MVLNSTRGIQRKTLVLHCWRTVPRKITSLPTFFLSLSASQGGTKVGWKATVAWRFVRNAKERAINARRGRFVIGKNRIDEKTREWAEKKERKRKKEREGEKKLAAPFWEQRQHERISLTSRLFVPWQPFVCRRVRHWRKAKIMNLK